MAKEKYTHYYFEPTERNKKIYLTEERAKSVAKYFKVYKIEEEKPKLAISEKKLQPKKTPTRKPDKKKTVKQSPPKVKQKREKIKSEYKKYEDVIKKGLSNTSKLFSKYKTNADFSITASVNLDQAASNFGNVSLSSLQALISQPDEVKKAALLIYGNLIDDFVPFNSYKEKAKTRVYEEAKKYVAENPPRKLRGIRGEKNTTAFKQARKKKYNELLKEKASRSNWSNYMYGEDQFHLKDNVEITDNEITWLNTYAATQYKGNGMSKWQQEDSFKFPMQRGKQWNARALKHSGFMNEMNSALEDAIIKYANGNNKNFWHQIMKEQGYY